MFCHGWRTSFCCASVLDRPIAAGYAAYFNPPSYTSFGYSSSAGRQSDLSAKGWLDLLSRRFVGNKDTPRSFTNVDASTIAWTIINESQSVANGSFGITQGALATSAPHDRSYEYKNLLDALYGLSNSNIKDGVDLEITPNKVFNTFYPQRGSFLSQVVFEYGVNVVKYTLTEDATDMVNQVTAQGAGNGTSMVVATANAPTYLQASYRIRQATPAYKDVSLATTLQGHADRDLAERQVPQVIASITLSGANAPTFGSYGLGDIVVVKIVDGWLRVTGQYRIYGIRVSMGDNDEERITLIFNPN